MYKVIKKIVKSFWYLILMVLLLPIALWVVMLLPGVQKTIMGRAVEWFKNETGSGISFSKAAFTGVSSIGFDDLLILHPNGDTIIYSKEASFSAAALYQLIFTNNPNLAAIRKLEFDRSVFNLAIDSVGDINIKFFIDYLESKIDTTDTTPPSGKPFKIKSIQITNSVFTLKDTRGEKKERGVDFTNLRCNDLNIDVKNLTIRRDTVHMIIKKLALKEKGGFEVENMSAIFDLCKHHLFFDDVKIKTPLSDVNSQIVHMSFNKFKNFQVKTLYQKVFFGLEFNDTKVNLSDVGHFVDFFYGTDQEMKFAGKFQGPISKFKGTDFMLGWGEASVIRGKCDVDGLPKIRETFFVVKFDEFVTNTNDVLSFQLPKDYKINVPKNLEAFSYVSYRGNFTGFLNDFVSKGHIESNLGELYTDIMIVPDSMHQVGFDGKVKCKDFQLGCALGYESTVESLTGEARVKGYYSPKNKINADVNANIGQLAYNKYNYQNINVEGKIKHKKINGKLNINDPNLIMEAEGMTDLGIDIPIYKLKANVIDANLNALNISKTDSTFHASFLTESEIHGKSIDELNGEIRLINSLFTKSDRQIQLYDFKINIINTSDQNRLMLRSDIIDADISGKYKLSKLKDDFMNFLSDYIPTLIVNTNDSIIDDTHTKLKINAKLKRVQSFIGFFFPDYYVADNSIIDGSYHSEGKERLNINLSTPVFKYKQNEINGLVVNITSNDTVIFTSIGSRELNFNKRVRFENLTVISEIRNNNINFISRWINWDTAVYKGTISGNLLFAGTQNDKKYKLSLNPSEVIVHDSLWKLSRCSILIDSGKVTLDKLTIQSRDEILLAQGKLSDSPGDSMIFKAINFNLAYINFFTKRQGVEIKGKLNGDCYLLGIKNPLFFTDLSVSELTVNGEELGLCSLRSEWNNVKQSLNVDAKAQRGKLTVLNFQGDYFPARQGKMDFRISLNKLKTDIFNPFLPGVFSDIRGLMSGNLDLTGSNGKPSLSGKVKLQKCAFTIDYLNTRYNFTSDIEVISNNFLFNKLEVFDQYGNSAIVNGIIRTNYLRDIDINMNISTNNLLCLNTTMSDNNMYYGTAYVKGNVKIKGKPSALHFDIDATTGKNTRFFIPLSSESNVSEFNYITYTTRDTTESEPVKKSEQFHVDLSGIQMDFNLHITPSAEVQIIFDSKMGDIIKARGNGELKMSVNTLGKFDIFGEYIIEEGDYLFTLQNVINKKLEIQPGSALHWSGDPLNAQIDVTAIYRKKVSLSPLFSGAEEEYQGNATVDCQVFMTGVLLKPTVKYGIDLPYAQEDVKEAVRSKISTEEELTNQILSILIMNQFYVKSNNEGTSQSVFVPGVNASELLSNQLSNWLSQISNDFDIGVNYRPGSEITSQEVEVALSTQLFNDKLSINGSVDMRSNAAKDQAKNVVDVDLDYKLNKSGNLRARAYNRPSDDQEQDQKYTTGVGIFYMEEFSSFGELMNKYWSIITGKNKQKDKDKKDTDIDTN